ncbi:uncharacterized protein AC631_05388 [Debaryomyces fabryi]|uniref:Thiol-specific monooxygenase n=1 Tax=Debaryomyces fabryi TaxID=58627 RepID=A0A0V1PRM7_9ASCO|nr:uncharacterized protein AC631_05388 [Debaryomyces fabryi]KRZ98858.1 hypothetical protein AC631_05388 [Debaryomyces fabryi]CUM46472.1 unnamed protein product [Debaryomyces fabryi]
MMLVKYTRIAIIGGGPAGLAAAKSFGLLPTNFEVDLFERNDKLGGVWLYNEKKTNGLQDAIDINNPSVGRNEFFSPMYKHLETNITGKLMQYANSSFPSDVFAYPTRQEVFQYLQEYSHTIPKDTKIHLNSNVLSLTKRSKVWEVQVEDLKVKKTSIKQYDAIVLANGHFETPFIPKVEGLNSWHIKLPLSITHAKYYNDPNEFANKNVLVVGSSSSGSDIAIQLSVRCNKVYVSNRGNSLGPEFKNLRASVIGLITKYDFDNNKSVTTAEGDTISDIDTVIFCTGYRYDFPFLKSYMDDESILDPEGTVVHNLYKQMFYIPDPSLAFLVLPKLIVPMPLAESQAAVLSRVFSGKMKLPDTETMTSEYLKEFETKGKEFHNLKFPADADYCKSLQEWIDLNNLSDYGLHAPTWNKEKYDDRSKSGSMKSDRIAKIIKHANTLRDNGESFRLLQ